MPLQCLVFKFSIHKFDFFFHLKGNWYPFTSNIESLSLMQYYIWHCFNVGKLVLAHVAMYICSQWFFCCQATNRV